MAFVACPPPCPGSVLRDSGFARSLLPSPGHDRLGHFSLAGVYVSGLQGSRFRIGPATLLPSHESYDSLTALDTPLGREDLSTRLESATRLFGDYRDGTDSR
jgi:hypothetical protein